MILTKIKSMHMKRTGLGQDTLDYLIDIGNILTEKMVESEVPPMAALHGFMHGICLSSISMGMEREELKKFINDNMDLIYGISLEVASNSLQRGKPEADNVDGVNLKVN